MTRTPLFALFFLLAPLLFFAQRAAPVVEGRVHTDAGAPLIAAVRFQGHPFVAHSSPSGHFRIARRPGRLTATTPGHRIGWTSSLAPHIRLTPLPSEDNDDYSWTAPGPDAAAARNCANCHPQIHREWSGSAHARAADNPKLLALLYGTDGTIAPRRTWNLSVEHPAGAGVCVHCHAPTFQDPTLAYDFRTQKDVLTRGVHCDYCHKIADAPTDKLGLRLGRDGYPLQRPQEGEQLFFGPLPDAVRPGESFAHAPFYKESRYCASCHEGVLFGVHVYGTYSEWLDSPARRAGKECQSCHMAPTGTMTNIAPGRGGIERDPVSLASHGFPGGTPALLRKSLKLRVKVDRDPLQVRVGVELRADNVGHRVPTGFIDRHLVLVVEARDARGEHVAATAGPTLDAAAGRDLEGQAGWLYAKRLEAEGRSPVPFWVPVERVTDTRLHPGQADRRTFTFPAPAALVRTRVLYRKFWPETAAPFRWGDNEVVVLDEENWIE